ncbi:MFS transporter [Nocardiopsis aegyptia]|uniref:MFS family permease n=1 Tax=Nocardiopsis aegyptia TaxID=220378 RepID=A0A7Z0EIN0_9ACTN|nr:MFS transporter [Nocardiopsis aegyptia]NYJ32774.1 MFS family permease [Nocardiopsis aegyptia]
MSTATRRLALWAACAAQLMVVLDISVVNVALPSIRADLSLGGVAATWVALAYGLGFAGVLLVGARLADVLGTARVLGWGIALFTLASAVGGLATEGWTLIGARVVQGLSAAVVSPATFTLLTTAYPEGPARVRAIAVWTAVSLAGGGLGTVTGGVLTDLVSWRAVLLVNLPIGAAVALAAVALRWWTPDDRRGGRISLAGAVLATGGFTCATYALSVAGTPGSAVPFAAAGSASVLLFALLVAEQRRTPHRLVPAALLRDRPIVRGNLATALTAVCFQVGLWYFLTFRMQEQLGYTPLQAGLAFLPLTLGMLAVNTWATPRLMRRVPARALVCTGAAVAGLGLVWQALADSGPFALTILAPSVVVGVGGGLLNTPLATIVTTGVPAEQAGAASGLMNTGKQFGGAVGLAAATAVAAGAGTDRAAFLLMAAALGAVAVLAPRIRRRRAEPAPVSGAPGR